MALVTPFEKDRATDDSLSVAIDNFGRLSRALEVLIGHIEAGGAPDPAEARKTVHSYREWLLALVKERQKLEDKQKAASGIVQDYAVDFDAARTEVGRRLARLRAARDGGTVSE